MDPKGENTATSGKHLNEGTVLKIHLLFQQLCTSASFYTFSLETVFFCCSLQDRIYRHEHH